MEPIEFDESLVEPRAWKIKGVGAYGSDVDVVSLDQYHELAVQAENFKFSAQKWAEQARLSAIRAQQLNHASLIKNKAARELIKAHWANKDIAFYIQALADACNSDPLEEPKNDS